MLAILPVLLAILAPTCPTSALKMPEKCHLGANIAKQMLQPPLQAPPNTKKTLFSLCFCRFSAIQPMCQNSPKMLPKPPKLSPRSPSWRYHGPSWSQLAANLAPTSPILRPSSRQPGQFFSENRAQDAKRCPKISQHCSKTRFLSHRPPPGISKYTKTKIFFTFL